MKHLFFFIVFLNALFFVQSSTFSFDHLEALTVEKKQTSLLLHVDVNKTLIALDPASNQTIEQILNALLAERYKYKWASFLEEPISYQNYIENYLLPGSSYDQELKKKRRLLINHFVDFVQETHHPLEKQVLIDYDLLYKKLEGHYIFPSFLRLISNLKKQEINFHIILRTFGNDLDDVIYALEHEFPDEEFLSKGYFNNGILYVNSDLSEMVLTSPMEAYIFFKSNKHIAIQDNWKEWNDHQENQEYAKRFPIDLDDTDTLSLFFDDNVKINPSSPTNIVSPINVHNGEQLNILDLVDKKRIFKVDTFQAIIDDDYFIHLVDESLNITHLESVLN